MKTAHLSLCATFATTLALLSLCTAQQAGSPAASIGPCSTPEQAQLEFWVGDWDLTWPGNKPGDVDHGTNHIIRALDGCVVQEAFSAEQSGHLRGMSVSLFDSTAHKWKQTWVDNEGAYLDFVGEFRDGQMVLAREFNVSDGSRVIQRMVFKNITANELDWSWERSTDAGKTWQVVWPIHYKRRK